MKEIHIIENIYKTYIIIERKNEINNISVYIQKKL